MPPKLRARLIASGLLLALPFGVASVFAQDLCMQTVGGLAGVPDLTSPVTGDPGWNNAVQVHLSGDLGATVASKMVLGRAFDAMGQDSLYIGLSVDAPTTDPDTTVVLAISPNTGSTADDWRFHIGPHAAINAPQVTFWTNSATWNSSGGTVAVGGVGGDWQKNNVAKFVNGNHWELEFKIPIVTVSGSGGICLGCNNANNFRIYVNVMNTIVGTAPATGQDVWPPCNMNVNCDSIITSGFITQQTPAVAKWGTVWLKNAPANACTGVSLAWNDIGVQDPNNASTIISNIRRIPDANLPTCVGLPDGDTSFLGQTNVFVARPANNMSTDAKVSVAFRVANWGVPGSNPSTFAPLGNPDPANCTLGTTAPCAGIGTGANINPAPEAIVPAMGSKIYDTTTWKLTRKQSCFYKASSHQCIQVEMESSDPNTRFLNRSVQRNMNFIPASTIRQTAAISGDQGELPRGQKAHRFLLQLDQERQGPPFAGTAKPQPDCNCTTGGDYPRFRDERLAGAAQRAFGGRADHMLAWIVRSYVYTGNKIIINNKPFEYVRRAGDFGVVAGHQGPITSWTTKLSGKTLTPVVNREKSATNMYALTVAPKQTASVDAVITANEVPGRKNEVPGKKPDLLNKRSLKPAR